MQSVMQSLRFWMTHSKITKNDGLDIVNGAICIARGLLRITAYVN
jgi:hypothetical protein